MDATAAFSDNWKDRTPPTPTDPALNVWDNKDLLGTKKVVQDVFNGALQSHYGLIRY